MNWFKHDKSACGLFEGKRGPTPEDDDGDEEDDESKGEVGVEPRNLYDCAVSATASLTAKYVACG